MLQMVWQMSHVDASKSIWIGNGLCTLRTMATSYSLRGDMGALHTDEAGNGETAPRRLEIVLAGEEGATDY